MVVYTQFILHKKCIKTIRRNRRLNVLNIYVLDVYDAQILCHKT